MLAFPFQQTGNLQSQLITQAKGRQEKVNGQSTVHRRRFPRPGAGGDLDELDRAYGKWADQDFPASAYREVMDTYGVDHMILYPTAGFWITGVVLDNALRAYPINPEQ